MATDHRGNPLHAGKRTHDEVYTGIHADWNDALNTLERMPRTYDRNFDAKDPAYVAVRGNLHRALTAGLFNPDIQNRVDSKYSIWGPRDRMLSFHGGLNMSRNIMDDPDTAHISLSNDEYL